MTPELLEREAIGQTAIDGSEFESRRGGTAWPTARTATSSDSGGKESHGNHVSPGPPAATSSSGSTATWTDGTRLVAVSEPASDQQAVQLTERVRTRNTRLMTEALVALKRLAVEPLTDHREESFLEAAARLRRAAVAARSTAPRHAALALILSDALTFTPAATVTDASLLPVFRALSDLQDPFVSSETERQLVKQLLDEGWKLTAPMPDSLVDSLAAMFGA